MYPEWKKIPRDHHSWPLLVDGIDLVDKNERVDTAICELADMDLSGDPYQRGKPDSNSACRRCRARRELSRADSKRENSDREGIGEVA